MKPLKPFPCACGRGIATSCCERLGHPKQWLCSDCVKRWWDDFHASFGLAPDGKWHDVGVRRSGGSQVATVDGATVARSGARE